MSGLEKKMKKQASTDVLVIMLKTTVISALTAILFAGCTSLQLNRQGDLKKYLKSHIETYSENDGLVTVVTDQQVYFKANPAGNTVATVEFVVQVGQREGIPLLRTSHLYRLEDIDGIWTVIEAKTTNQSQAEAKWIHHANFHRQFDLVFYDLPWQID